MKTQDLAATAIAVPTPNYTLLLVDDNPTNLGVLLEILNDAEFRLLVAEDGEAALEQVQYIKPDLILLDVMMPRVDGFETCQRLKANPDTRDIPVIFMTALNETVDKVKGLSLGGVDYITKPIQSEEVLARVRVHLKLHTLQKQLQAQNQQLQQEIQERQQIERSLQLMVRAVSHDLRNPVTGLLMVLQNLLRRPQPSSSSESDSNSQPNTEIHADTVIISRSVLERMADSAQRQLNLINSLLDVHSDNQALSSAPSHDSSQSDAAAASASHSTAPNLILHCQSLHFHTVVADVIEDLEPLLNKYQVPLQVQVSETLPPIWGDPNQLWRVLENLITNAIKHNPPGIEVAIAAHPKETPSDSPVESPVESAEGAIAPSTQFLQCWIKDNGNGIPLEEQSHLFEAYQRGATRRHSPGIGLGLYLCRQIIEAHGGTIELHSVPEQGTTFGFTLPIAPQTP